MSKLYHERKFTLSAARQRVLNAIGRASGVRVFCLSGTLADTILQKEKEKEKTLDIREGEGSI